MKAKLIDAGIRDFIILKDGTVYNGCMIDNCIIKNGIPYETEIKGVIIFRIANDDSIRIPLGEELEEEVEIYEHCPVCLGDGDLDVDCPTCDGRGFLWDEES
jgi:hypothetical protein